MSINEKDDWFLYIYGGVLELSIEVELAWERMLTFSR
jgi:hypothetical protein